MLYASISPSPEPDSPLISIDYAAGGSGYYFHGGFFLPITWAKPKPDGRFLFLNGDMPLEVFPGTSYIAVADASLKGSIKISA